MKICKLKLKNLNSFREAVEIDFENPPLDDASLVAITGPTGSGKTTLLDAICVALYGRTPRLSGAGSQNPNHLISHGEKEGFAEVLFIANGTRYLATWSIRQRGAPRVQLFYADDGKLISDKLSTRGKSLGSSQNTVSEEVKSILGLDFDAFRRSVMLAQGEFAAFLKANSEDRRKILEATAGVHIYDLLRDALNRKVTEMQTAYDEVIDKLKGIPEVSSEQLAEAEAELDSLQTETDALDKKSRQIQQDKERETKREEDFQKLQASEKRQRELSSQQTEIDALESERALAEKAQRLFPEKQAFDTAASELESADEAARVATAEKTEAMQRLETDQADFDAKAGAFQEASDEYQQQTEVYTEAKSDIKRAEERFEAADKRTPDLEDLGEQIGTLEGKLTERGTKQTQLQEQIGEAQVFLDNNHLPVNSPQRLNTATGLLAELTAHQKQLETTSVNKVAYDNNVASLKQEIQKLSDTHAGLLWKKTDAETTLEDATAELNKLLATGTREEWTARKQQAARVQPIVRRGEEVVEDAENISEQASQLSDTVSSLNAELAQIEEKLQEQTEAYRHAVEEVERCEEALRSLILTNPINQLRQHLHTGEPCLVCGATEHPFAAVVEPESEGLLQETEAALAKAKVYAQAAQDQMQISKTKQTQAKHDIRSAVNRISEYTAEVKGLRDEEESLDRQWEEASPDFNIAFDSITEQNIKVSSDWIVEQIEKADAAIAALMEAEQERTTASHGYDIVTQQLQICENDIARETDSLNEVKEQLENISSAVEDLKMDIKSIETRFWELLPDAFHNVPPKEAKDLFEEKIKAVQAREDERDTAKAQLQILDVNIKADQSNLKDLKKRYEALQAEIDGYQREGEAFLDAVREKTDGLETEDTINAAIDRLETDLQAKGNARDAADKRLQKSRELLTQKRTAHDISEKLRAQCSEKFDNAYTDYTDKLRDAGFDSLAAHNEAFRDEAQLQATHSPN